MGAPTALESTLIRTDPEGKLPPLPVALQKQTVARILLCFAPFSSPHQFIRKFGGLENAESRPDLAIRLCRDREQQVSQKQAGHIPSLICLRSGFLL